MTVLHTRVFEVALSASVVRIELLLQSKWGPIIQKLKRKWNFSSPKLIFTLKKFRVSKVARKTNFFFLQIFVNCTSLFWYYWIWKSAPKRSCRYSEFLEIVCSRKLCLSASKIRQRICEFGNFTLLDKFRNIYMSKHHIINIISPAITRVLRKKSPTEDFHFDWKMFVSCPTTKIWKEIPCCVTFHSNPLQPHRHCIWCLQKAESIGILLKI